MSENEREREREHECTCVSGYKICESKVVCENVYEMRVICVVRKKERKRI